MSKKFNVQPRIKFGATFKVFFFISLLFTVYCLLFTLVDAKVYIDINSPAFKKIPIAIQEFSG
ncbi:MAG: hypothetical protein NT055_00090, partial [Nitrospirae bacterium]|nr:hypothetical protein [Nitrospirota bacterium]